MTHFEAGVVLRLFLNFGSFLSLFVLIKCVLIKKVYISNQPVFGVSGFNLPHRFFYKNYITQTWASRFLKKVRNDPKIFLSDSYWFTTISGIWPGYETFTWFKTGEWSILGTHFFRQLHFSTVSLRFGQNFKQLFENNWFLMDILVRNESSDQ